MRRIRAAFARLAGIFTKDGADAELLEELRTHLEMETEENLRRGMSPAEARRQALLASGGLPQAAGAVRAQRGLPWLENIAADFRYAARALRRAPAFTAIVVVTLALGIGANTAIFSVVRGVLLKPLPHRDGDRLVYLRHSMDGPGGSSLAFSVPEVRDLREGAPSLAGIAEYSSWTLVHQTDDGAARIDVGLVTGNYFDVMGLSPVLGRLTGPGDDGPGVPPVIVLTHEWWVSRFGADPDVVGRQLRLDGEPVTVIGVVEPAPFFPDRVVGLLNMAVSDHHLSATMVEGRTHRMTEVVARLASGATVEQARAEVAAVQARMAADFPDAYDAAAHHRIAVIPFRAALGEPARLTLGLLMAAAVFVLVIAAASVANLTLMRGVRRDQEFVVRAALGAGVARLRRLLLAENLVLTLLGAGVGLVIAVGGVRMLTLLADRYSPRADEIALDGIVLAFTLGLSLLVALLLSLLAALPGEGTVGAQIMAGGRRATAGLGRHRLQRGLVVVQVAMSVVLLAGAGLLTRTLVRLSAVETGLRTEEVLSMSVPLLTPAQILSDPGSDPWAKERYEQMRTEIAALPGVLQVGVGSPGPLRSSSVRFDVKAEGRTPAEGEAVPRAEYRTAGPEYFRAAGIPLVRGREFATTDRPGAASVVIVNQALVDRLFPGQDPIGRRIAWTGDILRFTPISGDWRTVVGVVANTRDGGLDAEPREAVFMPFAQSLALGGSLVIRAERDAAALVPAARRIIARIAPAAPIENVMTVAQIREQSVAPRRLNAVLISSFGLLALIIAAVGIAGVLAFSVSARTSEIGIRMSLGAAPGRVQRAILKEGGVLLGTGIALGAAIAALVVRVLRGLLFGVEPHDPVTFIGVAVLMATIGLVACWIPAARAARVDPVTAIRA
ncbi:MAG: ABC transporter permease [Gemmatimonadetes bacterium]|nr:ABC transporter permease [Gemmatimonadota bacterium]